jgi:hypothetical protein
MSGARPGRPGTGPQTRNQVVFDWLDTIIG